MINPNCLEIALVRVGDGGLLLVEVLGHGDDHGGDAGIHVGVLGVAQQPQSQRLPLKPELQQTLRPSLRTAW